MLTSMQVDLIRQSWKSVVPIGDTAAQLFYQRLFELDPGLCPLFDTVDMGEQRARLLRALGLVVANVDQIDMLVPVLENLGRRHGGYGVRDRHYETVGQALIWALEQGLGPAFTKEVRGAWIIAYGLLADVMRTAGRSDCQSAA